MSKEEIIRYWKQGYSVEQIVNMNEVVKVTKEDENVVKIIQNKVERTILEFQTKG